MAKQDKRSEELSGKEKHKKSKLESEPNRQSKKRRRETDQSEFPNSRQRKKVKKDSEFPDPAEDNTLSEQARKGLPLFSILRLTPPSATIRIYQMLPSRRLEVPKISPKLAAAECVVYRGSQCSVLT
jgi:hypothetical protein